MNIGIIGLGNIWNYQKQALSLMDKFNIIAICDIDPLKLKEQENMDCATYLNYEKLLCDKKIDCVLISTPPNSHYEIAKAAIKSGKHVLIEKPAVLDKNQLTNLYNLKRQNQLLMTAFHASYAEDIRWFKNELLNSFIKKYGEITGFECNFYDPYVIDGTIIEKARSLEGSWIDSGVNALSVIGSFLDLDRIEKITITKSLSTYEAFDTFSIGTLEFRGNEDNINYKGYIKTDWTLCQNHKSTKIFFKNADIKINLNHSEQAVDLIIDNEVKRVFQSKKNERLLQHYLSLFDDFYHSIYTKQDNYIFSKKIHDLLLYK